MHKLFFGFFPLTHLIPVRWCGFIYISTLDNFRMTTTSGHLFVHIGSFGVRQLKVLRLYFYQIFRNQLSFTTPDLEVVSKQLVTWCRLTFRFCFRSCVFTISIKNQSFKVSDSHRRAQMTNNCIKLFIFNITVCPSYQVFTAVD